MKRLLACLAFIPTLALADGHLSQDLPGFVDITGVASNDVLNIREEPDHRSTKVGELAFNARGVEIITLSDDERWALVNSNETAGWVRSKFLEQSSELPWYELAYPLSCFGTEPFWFFGTEEGAGFVQFEGMDAGETFFATNWKTGIAGRLPGTVAIGGGDASSGFTAVFKQDYCSDGMSDRIYGISIDLFVHGASGPRGYQGCCSIAP